MLVISCHADTNFREVTLKKLPGGWVEGHLDNFSGVHAVMKAYFSGKISRPGVRIELTCGEEQGLLGAKEVVKTLDPKDIVLVVDVTATPTKKDFVIEKCRDPRLRKMLKAAFRGLSYDLYPDCPDPVSTCDETDVYSRRCPLSCFICVPVTGGDYNAGVVKCRRRSLGAIAEALCRAARIPTKEVA
jgi:hypothetical protein